MPLLEGSRQNPKLFVVNGVTYLTITVEMKEYFGIRQGEDFNLFYVPDCNRRGQRFLGVWLEKSE